MKDQICLRVNLALFDGEGTAGETGALPAPQGEGGDLSPAPEAAPGPETGSVRTSTPGEQTGERDPEGEKAWRIEWLRRERDGLLQKREEQLRRDRVGQQARRWHREGELTGRVYPQFDMGRELDDPLFRNLLRAGIPVRQAYETTHMEDIKALLAQQVARQTEKRVVDAIRAKGSRPAENGTAGQSAFTVKQDVSKLSRQDRAEIARRVQRGETGIRF